MSYTDGAIEVVRRFVPQFKVRDKNVWHQKFIGWLLGLVGNKSYMKGFYTTIGYTVYTPLDSEPDWMVLLHEGMHAIQSRKLTRLLMGFLYLFPQVLGILSVLFWLTWLVPSAVGLVHWHGWCWVPALCPLFLLPLPTPWRALFEMEAYGISIKVHFWRSGTFREAEIERIADNFTGSNYYYMLPFRRFVLRKLRGYLAEAASSSVVRSEYELAILDFMRQKKLLNGQTL